MFTHVGAWNERKTINMASQLTALRYVNTLTLRARHSVLRCYRWWSNGFHDNVRVNECHDIQWPHSSNMPIFAIVYQGIICYQLQKVSIRCSWSTCKYKQALTVLKSATGTNSLFPTSLVAQRTYKSNSRSTSTGIDMSASGDSSI